MTTTPQDSRAADFNLELSRALRAFMDDHDITLVAVATYLGRTHGYVSQRTTGQGALPADIIGAVAVLAQLSPRSLMVELTARMHG
ncbi:MAG: hypothetical protein FWF90_11555 [Promicromonosporaceae bacterium]|nr:hypothetical protein [Promicromonosporaceae bacterium]